MKSYKSPVFLWLTFVVCSTARVLAAPGLPSEPAIGIDLNSADSAVPHRAEAQSAGPDTLGPLAVDLDQAAARESSFAADSQAAPRGVVTGPAARWTTDADATTEPPAPRWAQGTELPRAKATGDVFRSFEGLADSGSGAPADTALAVGSGHVVQAGVDGFVIFDKSGSLVRSLIRWESFFSDLLQNPPRSYLFEPRAVYSPEHDRYLLLVTGIDRPFRRSHFFLAVSQSSDPRGSWWIYRFNSEFPTDDAWLGDAALGVDTWGVYLTGNMYTWDENTFKWAVLWSLDTGVLEGGPARNSVQWDLRWPDESPAFGLRPALPHTISTEGATFFVNTRPQSGNQIALWRLTGDRGGTPVLTRDAITTSSYQAIGRQVDQPGTQVNLNGGDARVQNAIYAFRRVYATWTTDPTSGGTSSGVHWLKLDTDARGVVTEEILHGGEGWYYFYPAITVLGGSGQLLNTGLFFNIVERGSLFLSTAAYVSNVAGEDHFQLISQGGGVNSRPVASYNGAAYDFFRPGWMWGSVQYAGPRLPWKTRILAMAMDDQATNEGGATFCIPDAVTSCLVGGRFQVEIDWRDFSGSTGEGQVDSAGTDNSALLWFFNSDNWEVMVKVLDGCAINQHYWVFAAGTTDVAYTLRVTDTRNGQVSVYSNPLGNAAAAVTDTDAFATCP